MPKDNDFAQLGADYLDKFAVAEAYTAFLVREFTQLLAAERISLAMPVQGRVKTWPSVVEKLSRRGMTVSRIDEMTDLVGIRIIVQFKRDMPLVSELIWRNFAVKDAEDTSKRLEVDQFGYASTHFNLRPSCKEEIRRRYGHLAAEVQVRTTAQHVWASASHALQYKRETDAPPEFRRALYRISAFLEATDQELDRLVTERDKYSRAKLDTVADTNMNVDILRLALDQLLPRENKSVQDDYANLLTELSDRGVVTVRQLRTLIKKQLRKAQAYDKDIAERERARIDRHGIQIPSVDGPVALRLEGGAFSTHTGLVRLMIAFEYDPFYKKQRRPRPI